MEVVVTGMGIISAIGTNVDSNLQSLIDAKHGIGRLAHLESSLSDSMVFGEVNMSNDAMREYLEIPGTSPFSRTGLLGAMAIKECLESGAMNTKVIDLVSSTSTGGIDRSEQYYADLKKGNPCTLDDLIVHDSGDVTRRLANHFKLSGKQITISTACSSAANSIMMGTRMIKSGRTKHIIAGGSDALTNFTIHGFNSLNILDSEHCRPFSKNRKGLNLGEGAAYLLLESAESALNRNATILGYVKGYANTNDAYHQTASSPEGLGATAAMKTALEVSNMSPGEIDYINVHGTGTENNDASEGQAILNVFETPPPLSSTKAFTGHTLAAAGGLEAVYSILALNHGVVFPNLNFQEKMEQPDVVPQATLSKDISVNSVLSNSFGFGGNNTTLIFSKTAE